MHNRLLILFGCGFFFFTTLPYSYAMAECICQADKATTTITLTGFTRPQTILDITSEVSGRCDEIRADIGEAIPADTIFAHVDSTFIQLELQKNAIARNQEQLTLAFNQKQAERYRHLVTTKASAQTRLEELELKYKQTKLKLQQLNNEHERLRETLARHTIHAPADWLLIERQLETGEWVTTGQSCARVGDYQHLIIPLAVGPEELHYLQSTARFPLHITEVDILGTGSLQRIFPNFDLTTRKTKVEISLNDDTLARITDKRGGLRVEIPIIINDPMQAFLLPVEAIEERYEANWLTRENGQTLRIIVLGPEQTSNSTPTNRLRIVSSQIQTGDRFKCRKNKHKKGQKKQQTRLPPTP
jgi:RND family efflux transporter MFP subunit